METFRISKKSNDVISRTPLDTRYYSLVLSGNDVCMIIEKSMSYDLQEGSRLSLIKSASGNSGQMIKVCEDDVVIKKIEDNADNRYVYFEYTYIEPLTISSFMKISGTTGYRYKFYFTTDVNMAPHDFDCLDSYKMYVRRGNGDIIYFTDLAQCFPGELKPGMDVESPDGYCCDGQDRLFNYESMEKNSILAKTSGITEGNTFVPVAGDAVILSTNPYYYTNENGRIKLFGDGCNSGSMVSIEKYTDFFNLGVKLEEDYDTKRIFQEYQVNELFVKKIKNSIIPDFIDLEKVKYAPAFLSRDDVELATGLTFNLHFRSRNMVKYNELDPATRYTFEDVWHFDDATSGWNGNGLNALGQFDVKSMDDFYTTQNESFLNSSNLIGYLGFTDDDIYNQKNRVKKSFIRLLFYDGKNPLEQNLLFYSTIFLDSGDLYGKYVKRKAELMDADEDYDEVKNPVVWSPTASTDTTSAVTSQLTVNDEYDTAKSGEGFNLYLFRQDAPVELYNPEDPENTIQPIYMKVEFNHAGYGRTVPLIYWPKEMDGEREIDMPRKLTIENYLDNLYIKVGIALTDNGYVYFFPDTKSADDIEHGGRRNGIVWENDRIVFNLFEPMITPDSF